MPQISKNDYQEIKKAIEMVGMETWITKKELLNELALMGVRVNDRKWYYFVEKYNLNFCEGVETSFIAHSKSKGYRMTKDYELIKRSWEDFEKTGKNLLWKASKYKKAYAHSRNLSFIEEVSILEE